jgi:hypothetical protein
MSFAAMMRSTLLNFFARLARLPLALWLRRPRCGDSCEPQTLRELSEFSTAEGGVKPVYCKAGAYP